MAISNWLRSALFSHRRSLPPASLATHHSPLTTRHYSGPLTTSFCTFLRTAWPEPHAVRSIRGEPGRSANRQAFPSPPYPASSQDLRDPHIRQAGFRVSKTTHSAHRRSAWGGARACVLHRIAKDSAHDSDILSLRHHCPTLAGVSGKWSLLDGRSAMATGWLPSLSDGVRGPSHPPGGCSVTRPPTCRVTRPRAWSQASILNRFASSLAGG